MKKQREDEILDAIGDLRDIMVAKFEQVDARFEQVDARLDKVESRLDAIDCRFLDVNSEFGGIKSRLDKLESNQDLQLNILDKHTKMLTDLKHEQAFALARDERMEKDIAILKKKMKIA